MVTTRLGPETARQRRKRWNLMILVTMYAGYVAFMLCRNTLIAASPAMIEDPALGLDKETYGQLMSWPLGRSNRRQAGDRTRRRSDWRAKNLPARAAAHCRFERCFWTRLFVVAVQSIQF